MRIFGPYISLYGRQNSQNIIYNELLTPYHPYLTCTEYKYSVHIIKIFLFMNVKIIFSFHRYWINPTMSSFVFITPQTVYPPYFASIPIIKTYLSMTTHGSNMQHIMLSNSIEQCKALWPWSEHQVLWSKHHVPRMFG